jgi:hypothetical protein
VTKEVEIGIREEEIRGTTRAIWTRKIRERNYQSHDHHSDKMDSHKRR